MNDSTMKRAADEELRARLASHPGRRDVMTIDFPEVDYEIALRPATGAEYRAYLSEDKQPKSSSRLTLVLACLLFPDASTLNALAETLPALPRECFDAIDEAASPGTIDVFDLNDASAHRLSLPPEVVKKAIADHRAVKGVVIRRGEPSEVQFVLKPPPRATYDDFEDATGLASVVPAADRALYDCAIGLTQKQVVDLIEMHPGTPITLYRTMRELGGDRGPEGAPRKKARRVV